jgi:hypothetical protein
LGQVRDLTARPAGSPGGACPRVRIAQGGIKLSIAEYYQENQHKQCLKEFGIIDAPIFVGLGFLAIFAIGQSKLKQ